MPGQAATGGAEGGRDGGAGGRDGRRRRWPAEEAEAAGSATGRACCFPPASRSTTGGGEGGHDGADERRATAQMDPPRWAADRGQRRRIHEGEGLLLPSRERIDDDSTTVGGEWSGGYCCCCDDSTKKTEMGLGLEEDAAPGREDRSSRGRRSRSDERVAGLRSRPALIPC